MECKIIKQNGKKIAEVTADGVVVNKMVDVLELMLYQYHRGVERIILQTRHLHPRFFNLRSGLAGEVLQKISDYNMKLAIVGDFEKYSNKGLEAFITTCNRGNQMFFAESTETALGYLTKSEQPQSAEGNPVRKNNHSAR